MKRVFVAIFSILISINAISQDINRLERTNTTPAVKKNLALDFGMVKIPAGTFAMGSPANEAEREDSEVQHQVTVSAFYMGKNLVTQKEYQEVMGTNPSRFKGDNLPVERVSWFDAVEYCNKRSQKEGLTPAYIISGSGNNQTVKWNWNANGYRLPTEAEWEYAARGGLLSEGYKYSGSNNIDSVAWYSNDDTQESNIQPVGLKKANELGIYDMSGNVWEYCSDYYKESYTAYTQKNPTGPKKEDLNTGEDLRIIIRGGSFKHSAIGCQVSYRGWQKMGTIFNTGFRIVRVKKHEK